MMNYFDPSSFIFTLSPERKSYIHCINIRCRILYHLPLEITVDVENKTAIWSCMYCGHSFDYARMGPYPTIYKITRQKCYFSQAMGKEIIQRILDSYWKGVKLIIAGFEEDPRKITFTQEIDLKGKRNYAYVATPSDDDSVEEIEDPNKEKSEKMSLKESEFLLRSSDKKRVIGKYRIKPSGPILKESENSSSKEQTTVESTP